MTQHSLTLTEDSAERKTIPMARGLLDYFPAALAEVAKVSEFGHRKHNFPPNANLGWLRGVSVDHADCIIRHLADRGLKDHEGIRHSAYVAWRALAQLQEELEEAGATPGRGSIYPEETPEKAPVPHKIYLSGPMTGYPNHNIDAFEGAAQALRSAGHEVVTPHELATTLGFSRNSNGWDLPPEEYERFMEWDLEELETCQGVLFLPGWQLSGGAGREGVLAIERKIPLYEVFAEADSLEIVPLTPEDFLFKHTVERITPQKLAKPTIYGSAESGRVGP